jgi:glycosyltransferase involved in cell wall biosynthesis
MRILFFSTGCGVHEQRFLRALASSRHEIFFLALQTTPGLPDGLRRVTQVFWPKDQLSSEDQLLCRMPALLDILKRVRPDFVHAGPVQTCGFLSVLSEYCPVAVMSWGSDLLVRPELDPLDRWTATFALRHAEIFICDAECVRMKALSLRGGAFRKILQIPWGVDLQQCAPDSQGSEIRRALGWNDCFVLISTRNWEKSYDIFVTLEGFAAAHKEFPAARLVLLGSGSLKRDIESFIRDNNLQAAIHCPGRVDEARIANYFQAADVYVSSAPSDGSSVSLLQAFATGLPVIVADAVGNREWVSDENGWLAQVASKHSFTDCILKAARVGGSVRKRMSENNRRVAETRADWRVNSEKLLEMYDELEAEISARREKLQDI